MARARRSARRDQVIAAGGTGSAGGPCNNRSTLRGAYAAPFVVDQRPAAHSARVVRTHRSALQFALGVRGVVLTILTPSPERISSNAPVNLASRSRMKNRNAQIR